MSWTELRKQLAQRAGVSEKEAGAFWSAFNNQLVEALKQDKQVKINGLGTFKLQAVAPRKSVNVKTGESMTIEGYNKIAFIPESSVKELVESQKAQPAGKKAKAEPETDPLRKLGEQASEIVDILGELGQAPDKGKKANGRKAKVDKGEGMKGQTAKVKEEVQPVEKKEVVVVPEPPKKEEKKAEKPKKKYHFLRDTLICVVCLLLLLLLGYFFLRGQLSTWIESYIQSEPAQTEMVAEAEKQEQQETVVIPESPATEEAQAEKGDKTDGQKANDEKYAEGYEILTVEEMHQDSRLAWMAKRYYGDKKYWPYIYDANKDRIANPCRIQVGTPVRIPKLTAAQKDTTRAETREKLEWLTLEAEAACWAN